MFNLKEFLILICCCVSYGIAGCRQQQETLACESICMLDSNGALNCELRGAIILPSILLSKNKVEVSSEKILPVIDLAEKRIRSEGIIPSFIKLNWTYYDDGCDAALATIFAVDAYAKKCSHFIIGPSCEYSVAAVSRIAKYFYNDGLNILTGGALSFDFVKPKKECTDEFHMLTRVGIISFEDIANFTTNIMNHFHWKSAVFMYERDGYLEVAGEQTCRLMMTSMVKAFHAMGYNHSPFELDPIKNGTNARKEDLKREVGNSNSSKYYDIKVIECGRI